MNLQDEWDALPENDIMKRLAQESGVLPAGVEPYSGWSLWENYFTEHYGPDWDNLRRGRSDECDYCSGRKTTDTSQILSANAQRNKYGTCRTVKKSKRK